MVRIIRGSRAGSGIRGVNPELGKVTQQQMIERVPSNNPRANATRSDQALAELQRSDLAATFPIVQQASPNSSPVIGPAMQQRYKDALLGGQVNNPSLNRMIQDRDNLRVAYQQARSPQQRQDIAMRGRTLNMAIDQEVNRSAANMMRGSGASQRTLIPVEDFYVPAGQQGVAPALVINRPGGGSNSGQIQAAQTLDDVLSDVALQQSRVAPGTVESIYTGSKNYDPMGAGLTQEDILRYRQAVGLKGTQQANAQQRNQMYAMSEADRLRQFDIGNRDNAADTTAKLGQLDIDRPDFWTGDTQQPLGIPNAPPNYMMVREQYPLAPVRTASEGQYLALSQTPTGVSLPMVPRGNEALAPNFVLDAASIGGGSGGSTLPTVGLQYMNRINPQTGLTVTDTIMQGPGGGGARVLISDRGQYVQPGMSVPLGDVDLSTPGSLAFNKPLEPWAIPQVGTSGAGQYNNPRYSFENGVLFAQTPGDVMDIRPVNPRTGRVDESLIAQMNMRSAAADEYGRAVGQIRDQYDFGAEPIRDELGYVIQPNNPDVMKRNPAGVGDPKLVQQGEVAAANALDRYISADRALRGTEVDVTPYQVVARRLNIQGDNLQPESMMAPALTESAAGGIAAAEVKGQMMGGGRDYGLLEPVMTPVDPNQTLSVMVRQAKLDVLNKQRATVGLPPIDPNAPEGAAIVNAALEASHLERVRGQAKGLRDRAYQRQMEINNAQRTKHETELGMASPMYRRIETLQTGLGIGEPSAVRLNNWLVNRGVLASPSNNVYMDNGYDHISGMRQAMTTGGIRF